MVHQPPDPFVAPRGVVAYVQRVAEAGQGLPVVLYLRNDGIGLDAIEQLCQVPGVAGVKWASPTPLRLGRGDQAVRSQDRLGGRARRGLGAAALRGGRARLHLGADQRLAGAFGGDPHRAGGGRLSRANALIATMDPFEQLRAEEGNGTNVTVVKSALQMMGQDCGHVRPPGAWPLTERQSKELRRRLGEWGLLAGPRAATG